MGQPCQRLLTATKKGWRGGHEGKIQSVVVSTMPYSLLKSTKVVFTVHGAWHSPNTLPIMFQSGLLYYNLTILLTIFKVLKGTALIA